jgi:hypothetical protein
MEIETLAPMVSSPLDSCRGRGKCSLIPRIRSPRQNRILTSDSISTETPKIIVLFISEYSPKVGTVNVECNPSSTTQLIKK